MTINTTNKKTFELLNEEKVTLGRLLYTSNAFDNALIETEEKYLLTRITTGIWITQNNGGINRKTKSKIRVETGGVMLVTLFTKRKNTFLKNPMGGN